MYKNLERLLISSLPFFAACGSEMRYGGGPNIIAPPAPLDGPCQYVESYVVEPEFLEVVDVLVVVDKSGSMGQEGNATRFNEWYDLMVENLPKQQDWRVKVMNSDPAIVVEDDNPFFDPSSKNTAKNSLSKLSKTSAEMPFEAVFTYMESPHANWMRQHADLEVLVFTDEDDQSAFDDSTDDNYNRDFFVSYVLERRPISEIYFTGTVNLAPGISLCNLNEGWTGGRIINVADDLLGNINDICGNPSRWETHIQTIEDSAGKYEPLALTFIPDVDTIEVFVAGAALPDYMYWYESSGNQIEYETMNTPVGNTPIMVTYEIKKKKYNGDCPLEE